MNKKKVIIIGGGAAGFFAAINMAEMNKDLHITILEKSSKVLQKVKVSGGGRCNLTHACFEPQELTRFYPRGQKELLGPFHTFMCGDTMEWFDQRGVPVHIEEDGRVFPTSNSSQTVVDLFMNLSQKHGINIAFNQNVKGIQKTNGLFQIETKTTQFEAHNLLITTGGSTGLWNEIRKLGHHMISPVPSLFTFNINSHLLKGLQGLSVSNAKVIVAKEAIESEGPILITHWGLSGPCILKASALSARVLADLGYQFSVTINWLNRDIEEVLELLKEQRSTFSKTSVRNRSPFKEVPNRLWKKIADLAAIPVSSNWSDLSLKQFSKLSSALTECNFNSHGKTTFKEEFVTAGGVDLKEINFKRFESKLIEGLYFAGEVLNIDGLTGGFNFQNAWTGGYIAAQAIAE